MLSQIENSIIAQFKSLLASHGIPYRQMFAYGSRARGDATPDSDLDVLLIMDSYTRTEREIVSDCAWEAHAKTGIYVQTVVMTRAEFEDSPARSSLFVMAVREEGIAV
jgi:predicted nucleotidyltransferase